MTTETTEQIQRPPVILSKMRETDVGQPVVIGVVVGAAPNEAKAVIVSWDERFIHVRYKDGRGSVMSASLMRWDWTGHDGAVCKCGRPTTFVMDIPPDTYQCYGCAVENGTP